ncbi:hypothetical protein PanWU01x14_212470 [Parasponia andersonii]|uniref:Uncharacterized protein n=1 Tax=Parasponia andersonii TaxID=3476 RepID=A0A2P5BTD8_PARAD|nr:hypothetical protein PanWU01x14_212470 [Parasponia andersonii]
MTDYHDTQNSATYKQAIKATNQIEEPSLGFVRPADNRGGTSGSTAIIKQNNTQIQLLVQTVELLKDLQERVKKLETVIQSKPSSSSGTISEDLVEKLSKLSIVEQQPPPKKEPKGTLRVFRNPSLS